MFSKKIFSVATLLLPLMLHAERPKENPDPITGSESGPTEMKKVMMPAALPNVVFSWGQGEQEGMVHGAPGGEKKSPSSTTTTGSRPRATTSPGGGKFTDVGGLTPTGPRGSTTAGGNVVHQQIEGLPDQVYGGGNTTGQPKPAWPIGKPNTVKFSGKVHPFPDRVTEPTAAPGSKAGSATAARPSNLPEGIPPRITWPSPTGPAQRGPLHLPQQISASVMPDGTDAPPTGGSSTGGSTGGHMGGPGGFFKTSDPITGRPLNTNALALADSRKAIAEVSQAKLSRLATLLSLDADAKAATSTNAEEASLAASRIQKVAMLRLASVAAEQGGSIARIVSGIARVDAATQSAKPAMAFAGSGRSLIAGLLVVISVSGSNFAFADDGDALRVTLLDSKTNSSQTLDSVVIPKE